MRHTIPILLAALLAIAAAACGSSNDPPASTTPPATTTSSDEKIVLRVNGLEVTKSEFDVRYAQGMDGYASDGVDVTTTQFQDDLKTSLIERLTYELLLLDAAAEAGIAADQSDVDSQFSDVSDNFDTQEAFTQALEENHLDAEQLRTNIERGIVMNAFIAFHIENNVPESSIEPSESELQSAYEKYVAQLSGDVPAFEELRPQLVDQLRQQKTSGVIANLVRDLQSDAVIEVSF